MINSTPRIKSYMKPLLILLLISTLLRAYLAWSVELGNDEVYYRIFGLFPSLSYFDHPPMLAWLIHLTTMGSVETAELLVRLSAVVIGTLNTYIIYRIAGSGRTGFIAALLLTGSLYASIISGTFIMPDTPLTLFWMLALWIFTKILVPQSTSNQFINRSQSKTNCAMLVAGAMIGCAMLSKYTGLYLWGAATIYLLLFNRKWFKNWSLYLAPIITLVIFSPVLVWNFNNDFISFTFHSGRVVAESSINWLYFGREVFGGIFYNNPINYILIICAIVAYIKGRKYISKHLFSLLILFSIPLIVLFLAISVTRETLPHWSAPAYFALMILTAYWLNSIKNGLRWAYSSAILMVVVVLLAVCQINQGVIKLGQDTDSLSLGRGDITLDMYGWRQLGGKFATHFNKDKKAGWVGDNPQIINYRWDEAAHLDTYVALPNGLDLITIGDIIDTHFYDWITRYRGGYDPKRGAYLIISSRYFSNDLPIFKTLNIDGDTPSAIIEIERKDDHVLNFFIYRITPEQLATP